jgi:hypothetical protein
VDKVIAMKNMRLVLLVNVGFAFRAGANGIGTKAITCGPDINKITIKELSKNCCYFN